MNKNVVMLGAVGAGALLLFMWKKQSMGMKTPLGIPSAANSPGSKPRVDNQSQPWYTGPLNFVQSKEQDYVKNPALAQSDLQSVVHSASDVWGTVSGFFGSGGGTADHVDAAVPSTTSPSSDASVNSDPTSLNLPNSDSQQSNILGAQIGNYSDTLDMNIMNTQSSGSSGSYIDSSNADQMGQDNMLSA